MECGICGTTALRTCRKAYHHGWTGLEDIRKNARKPTLFFSLGYHGILVTQEVGLLHLFSGDTSGYLPPVETNLHQYKFKGSMSSPLNMNTRLYYINNYKDANGIPPPKRKGSGRCSQ